MADIDEDEMPRQAPATEEIDLSEEVQDFRFLQTVAYVTARDTNGPALTPT